MSQGYLLIGLGQKYIVENYHLVRTLRMQGETRPVSILVHKQDEEMAKNFKVFDDVVIFQPDINDSVYLDCQNDFERNCVYIRLNLEKYSTYDETINLDSDVLCQYSPNKIWDYMKENKFSVANMGNKVADPNWHWGESNNISKLLGKTIPSMHCGLTYVKKGEFADKFFESAREVFLNYDNYGCKRFFRGARTEEGIFAIVYAKLGILPIGYTEFPIMSFNYDGDEVIPSNKQILLDENNRVFEHDSYVPFIHMFEKMEGKNYQKLYYRIVKDSMFNVVLITSSIGTTFGKVSIEDRYKQTLKTIESVKKHIKNPFIIMNDISLVDAKEYLDDIKKKVNILIESGDEKDDIDKLICKLSKPEYLASVNYDRSLPELFMLYKMLLCVTRNINMLDLNRVFKISGRYYLTDDFDMNDYSSTYGKYVFLKSPIQSYPVFECRFWSMCKTNVTDFMKLIDIMGKHLQNQGNNMEHVFKRYIDPNNIIEFDKINVEGIMAFDGRDIKE